MDLKHPSQFHSDLTDDRLAIIAAALLDVRYSTLQEMKSEYDDNYTRETSIFGRSRNMLIQMYRSGQYSWFTVPHAEMNITFNIGSIPARFFRDDPYNPAKLGFFKISPTDGLFPMDDKTPLLWRFIVERALNEDGEDRVLFVGFNIYHEIVSEWIYQPTTTLLHAVDSSIPPSVEIPPAPVHPYKDQDEITNSKFDTNGS